jgi:hypothetical protein
MEFVLILIILALIFILIARKPAGHDTMTELSNFN